MAFEFSLATVLRVRDIVEQREERLLQRIQQQIAQTSQALAETNADISRWNVRGTTELFSLSVGRDFQASYAALQQLKLSREELLGQLEKLKQLREIQLTVYRASRCEREMLTDMRDKKRAVYNSGMTRRAQSTLDDNFVARQRRS